MFSVDKKNLVPTMTFCFKADVNMEDKHTLNINKFHLCVKLLLSLTTHQLAWTKLISIKLSWFYNFTFQLFFLV